MTSVGDDKGAKPPIKKLTGKDLFTASVKKKALAKNGKQMTDFDYWWSGFVCGEELGIEAGKKAAYDDVLGEFEDCVNRCRDEEHLWSFRVKGFALCLNCYWKFKKRIEKLKELGK